VSQVGGCPTLLSDAILTSGDVSTTQAAGEADGEAIGGADGGAANSDGDDNSNNSPDGTLRRSRSNVWMHYIKALAPTEPPRPGATTVAGST
jgi:hypothetical protein